LRDWLERVEAALKPLVDGSLRIVYMEGYQTGFTHAALALILVYLIFHPRRS
jgi:hypothetical protein